MLTCWRLGRNIPGRCIDHRRSPCPHTLVITGGHLVSTHWWGMTQSSASIYSGEGSSIFTSRLYNEILGTQYILVAGYKKTLYVEMQDALIQFNQVSSSLSLKYFAMYIRIVRLTQIQIVQVYFTFQDHHAAPRKIHFALALIFRSSERSPE